MCLLILKPMSEPRSILPLMTMSEQCADGPRLLPMYRFPLDTKSQQRSIARGYTPLVFFLRTACMSEHQTGCADGRWVEPMCLIVEHPTVSAHEMNATLGVHLIVYFSEAPRLRCSLFLLSFVRTPTSSKNGGASDRHSRGVIYNEQCLGTKNRIRSNCHVSEVCKLPEVIYHVSSSIERHVEMHGLFFKNNNVRTMCR